MDAVGSARASIGEARSASDVESCRELFREYQRSLGVDLCFQGFERELALLPGEYLPPDGVLLLARGHDGQPAGCGALRRLDDASGEMKRLYVRPAHRGTGLGRALAEDIVRRARAAGYRTLKLDTLPWLERAIGMYRGMGFVDTAPYNDNAVEGVRFMALDLERGAVTS